MANPTITDGIKKGSCEQWIKGEGGQIEQKEWEVERKNREKERTHRKTREI